METRAAFEMGYQSAAAGFFFDGMELIAALGPACGGIDALEGGIALLFAERDEVNAQMDWLAGLASHAYGARVEAPRGVDAYRRLLEDRVFDIVNRWSYIADIQHVNQLQAWFYAGFGLGRARTVVRGVELGARLREIAGEAAPLPGLPERLERLGAEAARQMQIAAQEDDLRAVRPLFEEVSRRMDGQAVALRGGLEAVVFGAAQREALEVIADTLRCVRVDFATPKER